MLNHIINFFSLKRKYLIYNLILRNLKIRYRGSYIGALWSFLVPAISATVYYFVFKHIMRFNIEDYFLYIISGIFSWNFISVSLIQGSESVALNKPILSKVYIAPCAFPLAETLTQFINFLLSLSVLLFIIISYGKLSPVLLALPIVYLSMFILTFSISNILSIAFIFFRDLRHVMTIIIQLLFYATPIIYPATMLPEKYKIWSYINPFWPQFKSIQNLIVHNNLPNSTDLLLITLWPIALCIVSISLYNKKEHRIVESL